MTSSIFGASSASSRCVRSGRRWDREVEAIRGRLPPGFAEQATQAAQGGQRDAGNLALAQDGTFDRITHPCRHRDTRSIRQANAVRVDLPPMIHDRQLTTAVRMPPIQNPHLACANMSIMDPVRRSVDTNMLVVIVRPDIKRGGREDRGGIAATPRSPRVPRLVAFPAGPRSQLNSRIPAH